MTSPRNRVGYSDVFRKTATFLHDNTITFDEDEENGSAQVGLAVTLGADDTVSLVGDGEFVLGRLELVESDGKCTVQTHGFMELPGGTSATLTLGEMIVGDLLVAAEGYIQAVATGTAAQLGHCRGWIQNNDDTAAVLVCL